MELGRIFRFKRNIVPLLSPEVFKEVLGSYTEGRGAGGKPWNGSNQPTYSSPRRGGGSGTDRAERVTGGAGAIRPDQLVA